MFLQEAHTVGLAGYSVWINSNTVLCGEGRGKAEPWGLLDLSVPEYSGGKAFVFADSPGGESSISYCVF